MVAMVTEQSLRPEVPPLEDMQGGGFAGAEEYIELMKACWHQVHF